MHWLILLQKHFLLLDIPGMQLPKADQPCQAYRHAYISLNSPQLAWLKDEARACDGRPEFRYAAIPAAYQPLALMKALRDSLRKCDESHGSCSST